MVCMTVWPGEIWEVKTTSRIIWLQNGASPGTSHPPFHPTIHTKNILPTSSHGSLLWNHSAHCCNHTSFVWLRIHVSGWRSWLGAIFHQVPIGQVQGLIWKSSLWDGSTIFSHVEGLLLYSSALAAKHRSAQGCRQKQPQLRKSHFKQKPWWALSASEARGRKWLGNCRQCLGDKGQQEHLYCHCHTLCADRRHPAAHAAVQQALTWKPEQTVEQHAWRHSRIPAAKSRLSTLLCPKVGCHASPCKQNEFSPLRWFQPCQRLPVTRGAVLQSSSQQTDDMPNVCARRREAAGLPAPLGRSVPRGAGGMWSSLPKCWQCLQSQTRQHSYSQRSECKTGLVTSQIWGIRGKNTQMVGHFP